MVDRVGLACTSLNEGFKCIARLAPDCESVSLAEVVGLPAEVVRARLADIFADPPRDVWFNVERRESEASSTVQYTVTPLDAGPDGRTAVVTATDTADVLATGSRCCTFCAHDVLRTAVDGILIVDAEGIILHVNSAGERMFGYGPGELLGKSIKLLMNPDIRRRHGDDIRSYLTSGDAPRIGAKTEVFISCKDGSLLPVELSVGELWVGSTRLYSGVARDISKRKSLEAALLASAQVAQAKEERIRLILEAALDAVITTDERGLITGWNPQAEQIFGWSSQEAIGRPIFELLFTGARREFYQGRLRAFLATGDAEILRQRVWTEAETRHCGRIAVEMALTPVKTVEGVSLSAFIQDVSAKQAADQAIARAHQELHEIISTISSALVVFEESGSTLTRNGVAESLFRTVPLVDGAQSLWDVPLSWDVGAVRAALRRTDGMLDPVHLDGVSIGDGGETRYFDIVIGEVRSGQARARRFLLNAVDVTERRMLHLQLAQAQKLESIGQLAAGIAHEINTPTQYVADNVRFLHDACAGLIGLLDFQASLIMEMACEEGLRAAQVLADKHAAYDLPYLVEQIPLAIAQSTEGLSRVASIVRAMKEFSHPYDDGKASVDLNHAIETTVSVSRNVWKYVAKMELRLDPGLPAVSCNVGQINQVVLNLIVNAAHAIEEAQIDEGELGTIVVATKTVDGDRVEISVSDTGPGIPEAAQSKVFDPFFTTKDVGKGTGQGLAIAHSVIVTQHKGTISFETQPGAGTTFRIRIPIEMAPHGAALEVA